LPERAMRRSADRRLGARSFIDSRRAMGELIHTSHIRLERIKGPIRHAYVESFDKPIRFGVHGAIKKFYGVEPEEEIPATLDYMIAAVGG
jgi:hypothetical protein